MIAIAAIGLTACVAPAPTNTGEGGGGSGDGEPTVPTGDDEVRLNELQLIGTHNSYKLAPHPQVLQWLMFGAAAVPEVRTALGDPIQLNYEHEPLPVQLARGLRTFELDVFADPDGGAFSRPALNELLQLGIPRPTGLDEPGLKVLHVQDIDERSSCPTLIACLGQLRDFSDANPAHLPIVINLELKEGALPAPFDLTPIAPFDADELDGVDAEIRSVLGDRLITPDDVRGDAADLRSAIDGDGWPTVAETRGRFLFFLDNAGATEARYLDGHPSLAGRVLFTSAGEGRPDGAVLKLNDPGDGTRIRSLVEDGYLVRTRADADVVSPSAEQRDIALASGAQIVHSDFPAGRVQHPGGYVVTFGTRVAARCNPVLTTPATCASAAAVEPR